MTIKGTYKLSYLLDKEPKDLLVIVELQQAEGLYVPMRNIWEGKVIVNDRPYVEDLSHCVDALSACERIGNKLKDEITIEAKNKGQKLKLKKVIIK